MTDITRLRITHRIAFCLRAFPVLIATAAIAGCSGIEKAPPQSSTSSATKSFQLDVPEIMRGTVGSETVIRGYQVETSPGYRPIVARGYGLVVGLNGKGSNQVSPQLRQYMLQEAAKNGIGQARFGERIGTMSPEQLIDSADTAVVVVEAIIPQGAPEGTRFDVRVYAAPGSDTRSLDGGTLWTTLLRPGSLAVGGKQAAALARARGPIFLNPFINADIDGAINETAGRILNGGEITKDMTLKLALANPSHARAEVIMAAVNTRFPEEPGQRQLTARGESDESIELTVPPSWHDRTEDFVKLLMHTTIAQSNAEAAAVFVKRTLLSNPNAHAEAASWRWQAMGTRVLPIIKDLYEHPEELPRLAALRAGANLDDGLVIPHLIDMAEAGTTLNRLQAISLLENMRSNPRIDASLRAMLNDENVEIRLRSYEALIARGDPFMDRFNVDGKFVLDVIPSEKPLVYITQIGQPRIAVFGRDLELDRPMTLSAWSNRLMIKGETMEPDLEVYFREESQNQGVILKSKPNLSEFVQFLAHKTSIERPAAGLDFSYGETVGALHQVWAQKHLDADFKLQQDRILAAIRRIQSEGEDVEERPELSAERGEGGDAPNGTKTGGAGSDLGRLSEAPVTVPSNNPNSLPRTDPPVKNPGN